MTYSHSLATNRQRFAVNNQNTTKFRSNETRLGPVSNAIILIVLACSLGFLYLTQVTKTNAFGYKINELMTESTTLQQEHDELEIAAARLQSLDKVKNSSVAKNMVSATPAGTLTN